MTSPRHDGFTKVKACVFDAYGTLFDVHSAVRRGGAALGDKAAPVSELWRQKQLEYTWLRSLMGRYEDFWAVTEAALRYAVRRLALTASEAQIARLMQAYLSLAAFPDVEAGLARLAPRPRAILSNGSPAMLAAAVASSGLGPSLQHVLSADAVRTANAHGRDGHECARGRGPDRRDRAFGRGSTWRNVIL